jgi:allene oxide cyclase
MKRLLPLLVSALAPFGANAAERLHVVEHAVNENTVHMGADAKADSLGDMLVFANPVNDATDKTQVGTDNGNCVRVEVGKSWECFWTLKLKDGMITIEGPFYDTGDSVFVITGGTGKYAGAKGQMKLHDRGTKPTSYDFVYELL